MEPEYDFLEFDLNLFQPSQFHRGGGTLCFRDEDIWKQYHQLVKKIYTKCGAPPAPPAICTDSGKLLELLEKFTDQGATEENVGEASRIVDSCL